MRRPSVAAAISSPLLTTAQAADNEKCYGVAAAGQNDCQAASNTCAGQVAEGGGGDALIYVPAGTCQKINGGSPEPSKADTRGCSIAAARRRFWPEARCHSRTARPRWRAYP